MSHVRSAAALLGSTAELAGALGGWDRVTLRSWSGRFDREE